MILLNNQNETKNNFIDNWSIGINYGGPAFNQELSAAIDSYRGHNIPGNNNSAWYYRDNSWFEQEDILKDRIDITGQRNI